MEDAIDPDEYFLLNARECEPRLEICRAAFAFRTGRRSLGTEGLCLSEQIWIERDGGMTPIIPQTLYDAFGFPLALRDYPACLRSLRSCSSSWRISFN